MIIHCPAWYLVFGDVKNKNGKGSPYSITECRVLELIPVLGSQPAGDVSHIPGGRLPLLSARPAVTPATLKRAATNFTHCLVNRGMTGENSLPKTVTRQCCNCDLNPGPSASESSTLTSRLSSHPLVMYWHLVDWMCVRVMSQNSLEDTEMNGDGCSDR